MNQGGELIGGEYRDVKPFEKGFTLPKLFSVK
jgi:hypothetical protein